MRYSSVPATESVETGTVSVPTTTGFKPFASEIENTTDVACPVTSAENGTMLPHTVVDGCTSEIVAMLFIALAKSPEFKI